MADESPKGGVQPGLQSDHNLGGHSSRTSFSCSRCPRGCGLPAIPKRNPKPSLGVAGLYGLHRCRPRLTVRSESEISDRCPGGAESVSAANIRFHVESRTRAATSFRGVQNSSRVYREIAARNYGNCDQYCRCWCRCGRPTSKEWLAQSPITVGNRRMDGTQVLVAHGSYRERLRKPR